MNDDPILHIDHDGHRVFVGRREVGLRLQEYRILNHLVDHVWEARTYPQLAAAMGGYADLNARLRVTETVKTLRQKLGEIQGFRLVNIRGYGYRIEIGEEWVGGLPANHGSGIGKLDRQVTGSTGYGPQPDLSNPDPLPSGINPGTKPSHPWRKPWAA